MFQEPYESSLMKFRLLNVRSSKTENGGDRIEYHYNCTVNLIKYKTLLTLIKFVSSASSAVAHAQ
jgi:hypothetical protein